VIGLRQPHARCAIDASATLEKCRGRVRKEITAMAGRGLLLHVATNAGNARKKRCVLADEGSLVHDAMKDGVAGKGRELGRREVQW